MHKHSYTYRSINITWHYEISFDLMILQICIAFGTFAFLHFVIAIQALERLLGDVHASVCVSATESATESAKVGEMI